MNIDNFVEIGNQHKVCEDYVISGSDPVPYNILADGCSSSYNTEMGARLLCHLAKQYLKYRNDELHDLDYDNMGSWIIHNAEMTARQLGLNLSCLDATLIIAYHIDNILKVYIYGDGAVVGQTWSGNTEITSVQFEGNAPFYLSYLLDDFRFDLYDQAKYTKTLTCEYEDRSTLIDKIAYDHEVILSFNTGVYPTILICSDGIESFLDGTIHVPPRDIIYNILDFKTTKGEFLKRRLNKYMKNLSKINVGHYDDLAVGAFLKIEEQ